MNKNISISLFRVSGDRKYLDMVFSCPEGYFFTSLILEARYLSDGKFKSLSFDLSIALFGEQENYAQEDENELHRYVVRLPLDKIGITVPAIYFAHFKAAGECVQHVSEEDTEELISSCLDIIETDAICSDVVDAYRCMLDDLLMTERDLSCESPVSDEVIRKYLLIYGHTAALAAGDIETAEEYFRLIGNCFDKCGPKGRGHGSCCSGTCDGKHQHFRPMRINPCNCGRP